MAQQDKKKPHCLVLPFPAQGHINPMLQFAKRLRHKGLTATMLTTHYLLRTAFKSSRNSLAIESISDGHDEGGIDSAENIDSYCIKLRECGSDSLALLLQTGRYDAVIYDPHLPWALDVAREMGLLGVAFFTQPLVVYSVYYHVHRGLLKLPIECNEVAVHVPGLAPMEPSDLPSFVYKPDSYPGILTIALDQFGNIEDADYFLCNNFYKLEQDAVDVLAKLWCPLGTVGPMVPSMYLDKQISDDYHYGFNLVNPPDNDVCIEWLNGEPRRAKGSVVFVSFGTMSGLVGAEQMEELAWGLKSSNCSFLWVVRSRGQIKLPENFLAETSDKGLVVSWCPQLEVLAHESVGCFLSHCGWNSTLEALSLGVPLIAMPQWADQSTNAKYVADVWGTGLKARSDEGGLVRRDEIAYCIRELMEGEARPEIKRNAEKWRALAKEAMDEGGSSDESIDKFIEFISDTNSRSSAHSTTT